MSRSGDTPGNGKGGGEGWFPSGLTANMERCWPLSIFASGAGLQGCVAGAERGSLAKECDISEAAATSGEGAEGAQLCGGRAGRVRGGRQGPAAGQRRHRGTRAGQRRSRC